MFRSRSAVGVTGMTVTVPEDIGDGIDGFKGDMATKGIHVGIAAHRRRIRWAARHAPGDQVAAATLERLIADGARDVPRV